jgi:hypothetical protein
MILEPATQVIKTLKEDGFYQFQSPILTVGELDNIIQIQEQVFKPNDDSYQFGKAARIGPKENWTQTPIYSAFNHPTVNEIALQFFGTQPSFNEIFFTHDYKNNQGLARNGHLHFDRIPTLKFFVYLSDVDESSGPFRYVPGSYKLGKRLRVEANSSTNVYEKIPNRLEIDYPELEYTADNTVPVTGPAGTMFVFHSDLFHMGGEVEGSGFRRIMRIHLRSE